MTKNDSFLFDCSSIYLSFQTDLIALRRKYGFKLTLDKATDELKKIQFWLVECCAGQDDQNKRKLIINSLHKVLSFFIPEFQSDLDEKSTDKPEEDPLQSVNLIYKEICRVS
jgi:hypothetical protein